jgi:ribosomal protein RSM22 (predicted rRNA methylase)
MIILSNVLNELIPYDEGKISKRVGFLNDICSRFLADEGSCIVIEPALRETSRDMLKVRDGLLERRFHIYSPCLFSGKCPALVNSKDWCHEDALWEPPDLIKEIDRLTGLRKDSLKYSYLVVRKNDFSLKDAYDHKAFRVVSEPLVTKGKTEFYICGLGGRRLVTRFDKDRTRMNHLFEIMQRGNVISFEQLIDEGKRLKVGKETTVSFLLR